MLQRRANRQMGGDAAGCCAFYRHRVILAGCRSERDGIIEMNETHIGKKPRKHTNHLIYSRVAPGFLDELQELNPKQANRTRKWRHRRWFTPDPGYIKLNQPIAAIMAIMQASADRAIFRRNLQRAFPKLRAQLELDL